MDAWKLEIGICPCFLFGLRTYKYEDGHDHVLYLGFLMLIFSTYYD